MNKKTLLFLFLGFVSINTFGQTRYLDSLFMATMSQQDVVYGQADALNAPYLSESSTYVQDLLLDVYEPQGDIATDRPCIVMAHGGAFLLGTKTDAPVVKLCNKMAEKGYVVVSIEYRLGFNLFVGTAAERAVYRGLQDMKTAIRYVKENATTLNIDTTKVFAMGNSAGGVMALNAAYFDESEKSLIPSLSTTPDLGCGSCSGNVYTHDDVPIAIANLWGAVSDTALIGANNNVPLVSFHGTDDQTVSPNEAHPFGYQTFPTLQGSTLIDIRLQNLNILTEYNSFAGEDHEPWGIAGETPIFDTIVDRTSIFFYQFLNQTTSTSTFASNLAFNVFPNPATDYLNIEMENISHEPLSIQIVNALGQTFMHKEISSNNATYQLSLRELPAGWYAIRVYNSTVKATKTFLKK